MDNNEETTLSSPPSTPKDRMANGTSSSVTAVPLPPSQKLLHAAAKKRTGTAAAAAEIRLRAGRDFLSRLDHDDSSSSSSSSDDEDEEGDDNDEEDDETQQVSSPDLEIQTLLLCEAVYRRDFERAEDALRAGASPSLRVPMERFRENPVCAFDLFVCNAHPDTLQKYAGRAGKLRLYDIILEHTSERVLYEHLEDSLWMNLLNHIVMCGGVRTLRNYMKKYRRLLEFRSLHRAKQDEYELLSECARIKHRFVHNTSNAIERSFDRSRKRSAEGGDANDFRKAVKAVVEYGRVKRRRGNGRRPIGDDRVYRTDIIDD